MVEPETKREIVIVVQEFQKNVEGRLSILQASFDGQFSLVQRMFWATIGLIGTILIGAIALYSEIGGLKTDIAVLGEGFERLERSVSDLQVGIDGGLSNQMAALNRVEGLLAGQSAPAEIAAYERQPEIVREILGVAPVTRRPPEIVVGDTLPDDALKALPEKLIDKLPMLKDVRYAVDVNNAIALVFPNKNRVFAIL